MVLAAGLLTTYLGLRLTALDVAKVWIGGMMSAYYLGLVLGSKIGHRLISRVGHIRAFVASAGVVTASALGHALVDNLWVWLALRLIVGICMMCQYMVLESWLNEQADAKNRGTIFASYMICFVLGPSPWPRRHEFESRVDHQTTAAGSNVFFLVYCPPSINTTYPPYTASPSPAANQSILAKGCHSL